MIIGASSFTTPVVRATKDIKDLLCVGLDDRDVLWTLGTSKENADAAHGVRSHEGHWTPGVVATLQRLQGYCCWFCMEIHVTEFVKQCLHCMDSKAGEKIPRPLGETMHRTRPKAAKMRPIS